MNTVFNETHSALSYSNHFLAEEWLELLEEMRIEHYQMEAEKRLADRLKKMLDLQQELEKEKKAFKSDLVDSLRNNDISQENYRVLTGMIEFLF